VSSALACIAVTDYAASSPIGEGFGPLPQAGRNVDRLAPALKAAVNLPESPVVRELRNPGSSDEIAAFVAHAGLAADELFIVYYSGHGAIGTDGHLLLTHAETRLQLLDHESLDFDRIRKACLSSRARWRVVILDCCYSGAAIVGQLSDDSLRGQLLVNGSCVIASSPATRASEYDPDEEMTAFSAALVSVLEDAARPNEYPLNDLFTEVRALMVGSGRPEPQMAETNQLGSVPMFRRLAQRPSASGTTSSDGTAIREDDVQAAALWDTGLRHLYSDLNDEDNRTVARRIRGAKNLFFVAHTGYNALVSQYQNALRDAVQAGCRLQVVVSDPDGPLMGEPDLTRRMCPSIRQAGEIKDVLTSCARHQERAVERDYPPANVQVRLYKGPPTMNALLAGGWLRVIHYFPLLDAAESPVAEFEFDQRQPPPVVQKYLRAIDMLWKDARPVDLSVHAAV
jgi:hypothetical protein